LNYTLNRSDAALEHFVSYPQALQDELGLLPEAETIQLAQEIADQKPESCLTNLVKTFVFSVVVVLMCAGPGVGWLLHQYCLL
jgi:hypothetical protein